MTILLNGKKEEPYHNRIYIYIYILVFFLEQLINKKILFVFFLLNRLENDWINDESEKLFARFITLLGDFTYAGFNELKLSNRPETIVDIPNFILPQPKKTGRKKKRDKSYFFISYIISFN